MDRVRKNGKGKIQGQVKSTDKKRHTGTEFIKTNPDPFCLMKSSILYLLFLCTGIKTPALDQLKRILFRDIGLSLIEDGAIKTFLEE